MMTDLRLTILLFFSCLLLPTMASGDASFEASVVRICLDQDCRSAGTGFIAAVQNDAAFVVTARHVVLGKEKIEVSFMVDVSRSYPVDSQSLDEAADLALLRVPGAPKNIEPLAISGTDPPAGRTANLVGFPQHAKTLYVDTATLSSRAGTRLKFTGAVAEGSSGSPLIYEGHVAGLVIGKERSYHQAVPSSILLGALKTWLPDTLLPQAYSMIDIVDRAEEIVEVATRVEKRQTLDPESELEVHGRYVAKTWWLGFRKITFGPGATLVFPESVYRENPDLYLIAEEIVVDPEQPPTLIWEASVPDKPQSRGQAGSGPAGDGAGADGRPGNHGAPGIAGTPGADGPNLGLFTLKINGPLHIDFRGASGGEGGQGQKGGQGGAGARGRSAMQESEKVLGSRVWLPSCRRGPGEGGDGGVGGVGGTGGKGGDGGQGGRVTLVSSEEALPMIAQRIRIDVSGGPGGAGGSGGAGGDGGARGEEGELANFCNSANRYGSAGDDGASGEPGDDGLAGPAGRMFVSILAQDKFRDMFGFRR